jgi:hypothetical protein
MAVAWAAIGLDSGRFGAREAHSGAALARSLAGQRVRPAGTFERCPNKRAEWTPLSRRELILRIKVRAIRPKR